MKYHLKIIAHNDNPDLCGKVNQAFPDIVSIEFILLQINKYIYEYIIIDGTTITEVSIKEVPNDFNILED